MSENEFFETKSEFVEQADEVRRTQGLFVTTPDLSKRIDA